MSKLLLYAAKDISLKLALKRQPRPLKQQSPDIAIGALYPAPESNRHGFPQVFETSASTNSASWACFLSEGGFKSSEAGCKCI